MTEAEKHAQAANFTEMALHIHEVTKDALGAKFRAVIDPYKQRLKEVERWTKQPVFLWVLDMVNDAKTEAERQVWIAAYVDIKIHEYLKLDTPPSLN
jgi:hypothetical protein